MHLRVELLLPLFALAGEAHAGEVVLRASTRAPIAMLVSSTGKDRAVIDPRALVEALHAQAMKHTAFAPSSASPSIMSECAGALACIVRRVREEGAGAQLVLVASKVSVENFPDRVSFVLVDAAAVLAETARTTSDEALEVWIEQHAVLARRADVELANAADVERVAEDLFVRDLRPCFEAKDAWNTLGTIALAVDRAGLPLALDGSELGASGDGETRIADVRAGSRTLILQHPDRGRLAATLEVKPGETTTLALEQFTPLDRGTDPVLLYGGAGALAIGATLVVVAIATDHERSACFEAGRGCEPGSTFDGITAPLGYSLAGAGATWIAGAVLGDRSHWITLVFGLAAGGAAFGVSMIAD